MFFLPVQLTTRDISIEKTIGSETLDIDSLECSTVYRHICYKKVKKSAKNKHLIQRICSCDKTLTTHYSSCHIMLFGRIVVSEMHSYEMKLDVFSRMVVFIQKLCAKGESMQGCISKEKHKELK